MFKLWHLRRNNHQAQCDDEANAEERDNANDDEGDEEPDVTAVTPAGHRMEMTTIPTVSIDPETPTASQFEAEADAEVEAEADCENEKTGEIFDISNWKHLCLFECFCLMSGFLRGLFGTGGPPMMIFAVWFNVPKTLFQAANPFIIAFGSGLIMYINLYYIKGEFKIKLWPIYLCILFGSFIGTCTGNLMSPHIDKRMVQNMMQFFILIGAFGLVFVGLKTVAQLFSLIVFVIYLTLGVCLMSQIYRHRHDKSVRDSTSGRGSSNSDDVNGMGRYSSQRKLLGKKIRIAFG